ncbi:MAG: hypothetical protein ACLU62_01420 [Hydrogeniiclostridium sp.]
MEFRNQNCIERRLHLMNIGLYSKRFGETGPAALAGKIAFSYESYDTILLLFT